MTHVRARTLALVVVASGSLALPAGAQGAEVVVTRFDDRPPDGPLCFSTGDCTLREAVLLANTGGEPDVVRLANPGTYALTIAGGGDAGQGDLDVAFEGVTIVGPAEGGAVIDQQVAGQRVFEVVGLPLVLRDVTIAGGGQVPSGGAIRAVGGSLTIERVVLQGNVAEDGAGIAVTGGTQLVLVDATVSGNNALNGSGGISASNDGAPVRRATTVTITGGAVRANTGGGGAGIGVGPGVSVSMTGAEISGNTGDFGVGLYMAGDGTEALVLRDVTFAENTATANGFGAAFVAFGTTIDAEGVVLDGNSAPAFAGGALFDGVSGSFRDGYVVANDGGGEGGGLYIADSNEPAGNLRIERTLIEGNSAGTGGGLVVATSGTELDHVTISGNSAGSAGGARLLGPTSIAWSTIAANRSQAAMGSNLSIEAPLSLVGTLIGAPGGIPSPADDRNCVLAVVGAVTGTGNVVDDATCDVPPEGNRVEVDAGILPLAANGGPLATHALGDGSAAIDAAGDGCPATDARGMRRPVDGDQDGTALCDAGALEAQPLANLTTTLADGPDPVAAGEALVYTVTVFNAGPQPARSTSLVVEVPATLADPTPDDPAAECTVAPPTVTCSLGDLPSGASATIRIGGRPTEVGTLTATATTTSAAADPTPDDATATTTTTVTAGTAPPPPPSPPPPGTVDVRRIAGPSRVETAVAASQDAFGDGQAGAVVLARADLFPDALAGTPLAVARGGPLLLTPSNALHPAVAAELERVLPAGGDVVLLGGEPALSSAVASAVEDLGFAVERLAGADRFATAVQIAEEVGDPAVVFVADGGGFPDALAAGAAAGVVGGVVVLTSGSALPASTAAYLDEHADLRTVAVGQPAASAVPSAERLSGPSRVETALAVAERFAPSPPAVGLATGFDFPDALAGGAHVAPRGGPVLLTAPDALHPAVAERLSAVAEGLSTVVLYGGEPALSAAVEAGVRAAVS